MDEMGFGLEVIKCCLLKKNPFIFLFEFPQH